MGTGRTDHDRSQYIKYAAHRKLLLFYKSFTNNLAAVGDHHESAGVVLFQEIPKLDGLASLHNRQNDEFLLVRVGSLTLKNGGTPFQFIMDEIADGIRLVTDDREILTEVDVLNDAVDNEGFRHQAGEREKTGRGVKDETGGHGDEKIHHEKGGTDVEAGIFLQDHGQNIRTAAGSTDIKKNGTTQRRKEDGKDQLQNRLCGQRLRHGKELFHTA